MDDHLGMAIEVVKLFERLGAESPRLAMAVSTGEPAGTFTFSTEYPNAEAWGEVGDAINNDAEFQAFITRVSSPNAPSEILQFTTATEVPLRENTPARGNVIEVHVTRPVPGKFERGWCRPLEFANWSRRTAPPTPGSSNWDSPVSAVACRCSRGSART